METPDYDAVFERVMGRLPELVRRVEGERERATGLLRELQDLPPERRRPALGDPRFANPFLVDLLREASRAVRQRAPAEARDLADLARALARRRWRQAPS